MNMLFLKVVYVVKRYIYIFFKMSSFILKVRSWFKGELNPKIDSSSFEHLGIVEQLSEVF